MTDSQATAPAPRNADWIEAIAFDANGLVPAIAQEAETGRVLMFAWMNREAVAKTVELGEAVYYSRSRQRLWHKGEQSGHVQTVREIRLDCDGDVLLLSIEQHGGIACHTGRESCFYRRLGDGRWQVVDEVKKSPGAIYGERSMERPVATADSPPAARPSGDVLDRLAALLEERKGADADSSYVASLYRKGRAKIAQKVGEEGIEVALAAVGDDPNELTNEMADLWFHSLVLLADANQTPADVLAELERRFGLSGLEEKARRAQD